jgi:hypothetical protein
MRQKRTRIRKKLGRNKTRARKLTAVLAEINARYAGTFKRLAE